MKLYFSKGACSLAVRILINELNIPCEYEAVNLHTKKTETDADFLKTNPKGSVPVLMLDSKEVLTENSIIQQYLAEQNQATQLLPPVGNFNRYRVLEWLNFISTDLHKGASPMFNAEISEEIKEKIFRPALKKKLHLVDQHLSHHQYLMDEQYTLPDGYLFVILFWLKNLKIDIAEWKNLSRYFEELKKRKSIEKSLREEGF